MTYQYSMQYYWADTVDIRYSSYCPDDYLFYDDDDDYLHYSDLTSDTIYSVFILLLLYSDIRDYCRRLMSLRPVLTCYCYLLKRVVVTHYSCLFSVITVVFGIIAHYWLLISFRNEEESSEEESVMKKIVIMTSNEISKLM